MAKKKQHIKKPTQSQKAKKYLRSGSKEAKRILLMQNHHCDICGSSKDLEYHHKYYIRFGFPTRIEWGTLLCPRCHHLLHSKTDNYLNRLFAENRNTDFNVVYEEIKEQLKKQLNIPP